MAAKKPNKTAKRSTVGVGSEGAIKIKELPVDLLDGRHPEALLFLVEQVSLSLTERQDSLGTWRREFKEILQRILARTLDRLNRRLNGDGAEAGALVLAAEVPGFTLLTFPCQSGAGLELAAALSLVRRNESRTGVANVIIRFKDAVLLLVPVKDFKKSLVENGLWLIDSDNN